MHRREVLAVEQNPPRDSPTQLQHRATQRGLAAAGLSDQAKRLAARNLQAYVGHRVYSLAADGILNDEVLHLEKGSRELDCWVSCIMRQTPAVT